MITPGEAMLPMQVEAVVPRVRPRVGILDTCDLPSGISRYVEVLLRGIDPEEFEVTLFCCRRNPYRLPSNIQVVFLSSDEGIAPSSGEQCFEPWKRGYGFLVRMLQRGWRGITPQPVKLWIGFLRQVFRLRQFFRNHPVDLLHTQIVSSDEAVVAARLAGIPRVLGTLHIDSTQSRWRHWPLEWLTNQAMHRVIAVSGATRDDWVKRTWLPAGRVTVIANAVDPQRLTRQVGRAEARARLGLREQCLTIGAVGRLAPQKGYSYLLEATALLARDFPGLTVALAGDGPLRQELLDLARQLGIADRVFFLGYCEDILSVLEAVDVFALPSVWEAMPYALLEAMAAGLPVVGANVAGVPEVIAEGETGLLVPPRDAPALAEALRPLLRSPDLRERMGEAGRQRIMRHFHLRDMLGTTLALYREMLARNSLVARNGEASLSNCQTTKSNTRLRG